MVGLNLFGCQTVLLASPMKLNRFIEASQLTEDLGGFLPYDHNEWLDVHLVRINE